MKSPFFPGTICGQQRHRLRLLRRKDLANRRKQSALLRKLEGFNFILPFVHSFITHSFIHPLIHENGRCWTEG
jgi:hypothetical protein